MDGCRFCPEVILWAKNEYTGRPMPLDAKAIPEGNVVGENRDGVLYVHVLSHRERERLLTAQPGRLFFIEHHATCTGRHRVDAGEHVGQQSLAV